MGTKDYYAIAEQYSFVTEKWGFNGPQEVIWKYPNGEKVPVTFVKGVPQGYKHLGGIGGLYGGANFDTSIIDETKDWLEWSTGMHTHHYLSPSLKVWYTKDTSD
jgi:hypothetical protein